MKKIALATIFVFLTSLIALPAAQAAPSSGLTVPISGSGSGATFTGTYTIQKFISSGGGIAAVGTLTGTLTTALGVVTTIVQRVTMPVAIGQTTCDILHLDIGPISLDLLGLQVDLSRIVLDITAQAGAGNLLGNLLCAVAGLLDNPGQLANLLNQILALL